MGSPNKGHNMTTRLEYIAVVHDMLGVLATTAGLTAIEADYGNQLTAAFHILTGSGDLPDDADVNYTDVINLLELLMLRKLLNYYAFYVDTAVGPRKEQYSQTLKAVERRVVYPVYSIDTPEDFGELDAYGASYGTFDIDWFETTDNVF